MRYGYKRRLRLLKFLGMQQVLSRSDRHGFWEPTRDLLRDNTANHCDPLAGAAGGRRKAAKGVCGTSSHRASSAVRIP